MPRVPTSAPAPSPNVVQLRPPPDETSLAMAAAMLHAEGKLFTPPSGDAKVEDLD